MRGPSIFLEFDGIGRKGYLKKLFKKSRLDLFANRIVNKWNCLSFDSCVNCITLYVLEVYEIYDIIL